MWEGFEVLSIEKDFSYEKCMLDTGDIVCGNIVIERKEAIDFVKSLIDGRLREQSAKMSMNYPYKYVILEGNPYQTDSKIHHNALIGMMTSLSVKHNIKFMFSESPLHTVYMAYSIIKKHMDNETFDPNDFQKNVFKLSNEEILVAMLYQIPGLGLDKVKVIAEKYDNSLYKFVNEVTPEVLQSIDGIGKVTAEKIIKIIKK